MDSHHGWAGKLESYFCLVGGISTCWSYGEEAPRLAQPVQDCFSQFLGICFVIPPEAKGGIFGFSEFVQAFALLVLIFTVTGVRYQFRVDTAPIRLWLVSYCIAGAIGITALASDLWFSQRYPLPSFLSVQAYWQAFLGFSFLLLTLIWLWFAYIRPPKFGKRNAYAYTRAVYRHVMQGGESDLPVIADELGRSAKSIVAFASETNGAKSDKPSPENYARDLLLIIGNRRFCKHVAASAPYTAIALFRAVEENKSYHIPFFQFAAALSTEAILNKDSLLYHEEAGFYSGYLGYTRPFTNSVYGSFPFIEALASNGNSPLDIDLEVRWNFDSQQLEAYTRAVLTTFKSALANDYFYENSTPLNRAFDVIQSSCSDLYRIDEGITQVEKSEILAKLRAVVRFVNNLIKAMEDAGIKQTVLRRHNESWKWHKDFYDVVADLIFEIIGSASSVKTSDFDNWSVQHNYLWSAIFNWDSSPTRKIITFKVRRLLYDEIKSLRTLPNFQNAKYFGFCLNVLGLKVGEKRDHRRHEYQLRKAVIAFATENYLSLRDRQPKVAAAVLMGTISFDDSTRQLVKTYAEGLDLVAPTEKLDLLPPSAS